MSAHVQGVLSQVVVLKAQVNDLVGSVALLQELTVTLQSRVADLALENAELRKTVTMHSRTVRPREKAADTGNERAKCNLSAANDGGHWLVSRVPTRGLGVLLMITRVLNVD